MALTATERKRRQVERDRQAMKLEAAGDEFLKRKFAEVAPWDDLRMHLKEIGVPQPPEYEADGDHDPDWDSEDIDGPYRGSLGRAERMIDTFHAMAVLLATGINQFKAKEFEARIAEIEAADLTDPAIKKQALADIAKLTKYRDQLSKNTRFEIPIYRLKGE